MTFTKCSLNTPLVKSQKKGVGGVFKPNRTVLFIKLWCVMLLTEVEVDPILPENKTWGQGRSVKFQHYELAYRLGQLYY